MHKLSLMFLGLLFIPFAAIGKPPKTRMVFAFEDAPRTYDPRYAVDANSQYVEGLVHCSLIDFDNQGKAVPYLADSWKWLHSQTLKVRIKDGVSFSDGKPVSPEDVKASYEFFFAQKTHVSPRSGAFRGITDIKVDGSDLR